MKMKKYFTFFIIISVVLVITLVVGGLSFWGIDFYKYKTSNDAAVIQFYTYKNIIRPPIGVVVPPPVNQDIITSTATSTSCTCACPYAEKIVILGKGSTASAPEVGWFQENVRGSTIFPLDGGIDARIRQIEDKIKTIQGNKCPQKKILIVGYSLGGAIAKNLKSKYSCVDVIAIDPPNSEWCNFFIAKLVSPSLRQICSSNNVSADMTINWTNGNSGDASNHHPWSDPVTNKSKLEGLKRSIDSKKCIP